MSLGPCSYLDEIDFDSLTDCDFETLEPKLFEMILSSRKEI